MADSAGDGRSCRNGLAPDQLSRGRILVRQRDKLLQLAGDSYDTAEREYVRLMAEV